MKIPLYLAVLISLTACTVGPDYQAPKPHIKTKAFAAVSATSSKGIVNQPAQKRWWKNFNDPLLSQFIDRLTVQNLDLAQARQRLLQARALRSIEHSRSGPQMTGVGSWTNEHISQYGRMLGTFPNNPVFQSIPLDRNVYQPGFDASWEMDVFGQIQRREQRRSADEDAAVANIADVLRLMRAELARAYFELRSTQHREVLLNDNIALLQKNLNLTRKRLKAGTTNAVDEALTSSQLQSIRAELPKLRGQEQALAIQLSLLLAEEPMSLWSQLAKPRPLPTIPSKIAVGIPSDLLRRRPDIAQAERQIAAASAEIGVAVADLYPKFNLTANASLESLFLDTLMRSKSAVWTLGPFVQWAWLDSGRIRANIKLRESEYHSAVLTYQKTVLQALADAQSAIFKFQQSQSSDTAYKQAVQANEHAVRLSRQRYQEGEDDVLALIQAQQGLITAKNNALLARQESLIQLVAVYKSVGGEWLTA